MKKGTNVPKGANKRQPNPDAPGKNETHSDLRPANKSQALN